MLAQIVLHEYTILCVCVVCVYLYIYIKICTLYDKYGKLKLLILSMDWVLAALILLDGRIYGEVPTFLAWLYPAMTIYIQLCWNIFMVETQI